MSSIEHSTGFYKPSPSNAHRSNRVGSFGSSSSNGSNMSNLSYSSISYEQMLPPPPNVFGSGIARPPSRGNGNSSISSGRNRPPSMNFSKPSDDTQNPASEQPIPSPRAALVAGLRSATDRRHQQREQQQQQQQQVLQQQQQLRLQNLSLYDAMNSGNTSVYSSSFANSQNYGSLKSPVASSFGLSPPTSPIPSDYSVESSLNNSPLTAMSDRPDSRVLASLQQKHQELMATSAAIAQQQQRLAQAINQAALSYGGYYNPNDPSFELPVLSSSPGLARSPIITPQPLQSSQQQYARNSIYNDLPAPPGYNNFYRPSSPSLPTRPLSSSSFRPQFSQDPPKQSQANSPGYKRSHRKAASLSGSGPSFGNSSANGNSSLKGNNNSTNATPYYSSGSFGSGGSSSSVGNIGGGSQLRNSTLNPGLYGKGSEMPLRQPVGPPPIEELRGQKIVLNFASTSTVNSF